MASWPARDWVITASPSSAMTAGSPGPQIAWVRDYWNALHTYSTGGAYVNFMMEDEGEDRVRASYRENYDRLVEVKRQYDPQNLFHINQNIRP